MLNPKIKVATAEKYGEYCKTLIATETIEPGERVWWSGNGEDETLYTWDEITTEPDLTRKELLITYSYMVDVDTYASTIDPESDRDASWYFNHNCDGNCYYQGTKAVVARRLIEAGEELHYDYALTETEASFHAGMHCKCGAENCRGILKFDDYRKPAFWREYQNRTTTHIAKRGQECGWLAASCFVRRIPSIAGSMEKVRAQPAKTNNLGLDTNDKDGREHKGVFALQPILKGSVVAVFGGKTLRLEEAQALEVIYTNYPYFLQVESSLWQVPYQPNEPDAPDFINHSCAANCGMLDSTQVVALRDINKGEQITIDYAMVNDGVSKFASDNFECGCGSEFCRGSVSSSDWLLTKVQEKYWPMFSPFVKKKILEARSNDLKEVDSFSKELKLSHVASGKGSDKGVAAVDGGVAQIHFNAN